MRVSKKIVINRPGYQSIHLGVEDVSTFTVADAVIMQELERLGIPLNDHIKQCVLPEK